MNVHPADRPLYAMRLHPHRSLSKRNSRLLLMAFSGCAFFSSLPFVILGAWPVAGFMGVDVLIFALAFRANFRAARAYEEVLVTPVELLIAKVSVRGARREWRFNPSWVKLEREELEDYGVQRLALISRGRRLEIGGFLGPEAKADFADGLSLALAKARRGMCFD